MLKTSTLRQQAQQLFQECFSTEDKPLQPASLLPSMPSCILPCVSMTVGILSQALLRKLRRRNKDGPSTKAQRSASSGFESS